MVKLFPYQEKIIEEIKDRKRCLLAMEMGTGKTYVATEKLATIDFEYCLVICPKSLIPMWIEHIEKNYPQYEVNNYAKTKKIIKGINILNYDIVFRREELFRLKNLTVIIDECVALSNINSKRTKAVMKLDIENLIMLSGSISKGKYENLYPLAKLLGAKCTKKQFYERYIIEKELPMKNKPFPIKIIVGYKNCEELRNNMRKVGTVFLKSEQAISLPEQNFITVDINNTPEYKQFLKDRIITLEGETLVGDSTFSRILYERALCGIYNKNKHEMFKDLIDSTDDRLIVFYNFCHELDVLDTLTDRPKSYVNGKVRDLDNYEKCEDSITFINYASGSSGLNLQKANKIIYFSPCLSTEHYMQSLKRVHRLGQKKPCFYYFMTVKDSIEKKIYRALKRGEDYTNFLFESEE